MGIKKLFTFLNNNNLYKKYSYLNDLITELNIDKKKMLVGVDGNLFCYKYTHSYDNMLIGFFNQILKFLSNKIIPLYIFDGGTLQEKESTNYNRCQKKIMSKYRMEQLEDQMDELVENDDLNDEKKDELISIIKKLEKNSAKINRESINILLELFDLLNIPYIFSYGEGEYLAVLLNKYNIIDFFLTDDTDPIPAGINKSIKFYNNSVYYLETNQIFKKMNLNEKEFCDLCILFGSDYAVFNHGFKINEIYELIIKYKSIEEMIHNNILPHVDNEMLILINKIRNIYFNSCIYEKNMFLENKDFLKFDINSNINTNTKINKDKINNEIKSSINLIIDHSNISYYSNIMLEHWDEFIDVICLELNNNQQESVNKKSELFKQHVCKYISKSKFNIKNIIKFIKNNIHDITENEIKNMIASFEFLNTFGI